MKLEHLKDECPKMPENIRAMIEREVEVQMKKNDDEMRVERRFGRKSWKKVVAASLAATMAFGTTVYAGVKIYQWNVTEEGKHMIKLDVVSEDVAEPDENYWPKEVPVLDLELNYLPENMEITEGSVKGDGHTYAKASYKDTYAMGGISISVDGLFTEIDGEILTLNQPDVISWEEVKVNDRDAILIQKQVPKWEGIWHDRVLYVAYPEYDQLYTMFIGEDLSDEEAIKIAENVVLTPTEKTKTLEKPIYGNPPGYEEACDLKYQLTASYEEMKIHQVGEEFKVSEFLNAKVTDVRVSDDYEGLNEANIDYLMKNALGEDGKLKKNTIYYMKDGDGVNTLDETVKTEEVNQKLVEVTVEYTNTGAYAHEILFLGNFVGIVDDGSKYVAYERGRMTNDENVDGVEYSSRGRFGEMDYYDPHGGEANKNYIPSLKAGETATIHMAKVVNEDELDKLYFTPDQHSAIDVFDENTLTVGYVDIRQK